MLCGKIRPSTIHYSPFTINMKLLLAYPPIESEKGVPLLSQNRQFQWFNKPTFIYPMVPAYAATMAKEAGHEVLWADAIAEGWTTDQFESKYREFAPDFTLIEAKTPIIKAYWQTIKRLKEIHPTGLIALCGDHVTALPEESMQNCPVDFVITGGDYDFTLIELLTQLDRNSECGMRNAELKSCPRAKACLLSCSERQNAENAKRARKRRGRRVVLSGFGVLE